MEGPVKKCRFCNTELKKDPQMNRFICSNIECLSTDGFTVSNNFGGSLTIGKIQDLVKDINQSVYGDNEKTFSIIDSVNRQRRKQKKTIPLTSDDILDIREWSKKAEYYELYHFTRAKRKA